MSIHALILVLCAAVTHTAWNYLAKKTNGDNVFIWLIYTCSVVIFLPFASGVFDSATFTPSVLLFCLISGGLRLAYFIVLQHGYRKADLSIVYPLARGSAPGLATIAAMIVLHEKPTLCAASGLLLIMGGVIIMTKPRFSTFEKSLQSGAIYGLAAGILIAIYTVWDKVAITLHISPVLLTFASHVLGTVLLVPVAFKNKQSVIGHLRNNKSPMIGIAVLSPLSYIFVLEAMKSTDVIFIASAREVSILFTVLVSGKLMNEKNMKHRALGACFIVGGIIALTY